MGLLDGGIAAAFAGVFGGVYLDGSLYRRSAFADDGMGGGSDQEFTEEAVKVQIDQAVKVQIDQATQAMRASEGFVEGDVRILMLAHGVTAPDTDAEVGAGGTRYSVQSVATDAAGSYFELRGRAKA
jgi:hypothetical protein